MLAPTFEGKGHSRRMYRLDERDERISKGTMRERWRAWHIPNPDPAKWPASLAMYLIHAPGSHPLWPWHTISGVALRVIDGANPPVLHRPTSTHEITILSWNPESPDPDPADLLGSIERNRAADRSSFLSPPDLVVQLDDATDEMCSEIVLLMARAICDGHTSPDEDYRTVNENMIAATLAHMRQGKHIPS